MNRWLIAGVLSLLLGVALLVHSSDLHSVEAGYGVLVVAFGVVTVAACAIATRPRTWRRPARRGDRDLDGRSVRHGPFVGIWLTAGALSLLLGVALFVNAQDAQGVQAGLGILLFFFGIIDLVVCAIILIPRMFVRSVLEDETGLLASHLAERRHREQLAYEETRTANAIANERIRMSASAIPSEVVFCERCDALNIAGTTKCVSCDSPLTSDSSVKA